jgi:hypothetical protein
MKALPPVHKNHCDCCKTTVTVCTSVAAAALFSYDLMLQFFLLLESFLTSYSQQDLSKEELLHICFTIAFMFHAFVLQGSSLMVSEICNGECKVANC